MYRSTDSGASWTMLNLALNEFPTSFAVHEDLLFVGSFGNLQSPGVFMTSDLGETWSDVSDGLDNNLVSDILVNNGCAYVCTKGSGVYRRPLTEFIAEGISEARSENISIYPNPAGNNITINIPSGLVGSDIIITNELGQQVMSIGNAMATKFQLDCSSLAKGIYHVHVGNHDVKLVIL